MQARRTDAVKKADAAGWCRTVFETKKFDIIGFLPGHMPSKNRIITVYIEGDGLSWLSRTKVSPDPTPVNPLGLKMALRHPDACVVYLARPFQFGMKRNIDSRFWTSARFCSDVVNAYAQILNLLKKRFNTRVFYLVGYSGGGGLAALVAAQREDIGLLVTVAGNLDHKAWTRIHQISPLDESLNPADAWPHLIHIPQIHFGGEKDNIITNEVISGFTQRFPPGKRPLVQKIKNMGHGDEWNAIWPKLYAKTISLL
nr:hypothetical protein [uncultured Desulfobacter sp.]